MKRGLVRTALKGNYGVMMLDRPPVNAMNLELWEELLEAFEALEADPKVFGVVFASTVEKNVFTAGIDLSELNRETTTEERLVRFWTTMTKFLARVYRSHLFTIAAIRGQCPAGGCALAMACDYRIITSDGFIGLNESRLGIPVPTSWATLFVDLVGKAQGEYLLISGAMMDAKLAKELNFVHEVLTVSGVCATEAMDRAEDKMQEVLKTYMVGIGAQKTKEVLKMEKGLAWEAGAVEEALATWRVTGDKHVRRTLTAYAKRLGRM